MNREAHRQTGRVCVITGATSGIGRATAQALVQAGFRLVLTGRRKELGARLASGLERQFGLGKVDFIPADLSNQAQVRELARAIEDKHPRVDVLINNAGARFNQYQASSDGIELTFATNHLGHFLLTALLLGKLVAAPKPQVITVASGTHRSANADGSWNMGPSQYDRKLAYAKSKLANVLFSRELARRMADTELISNAVDPGGVATQLGRNNGLLSWLRHLTYYALKRELLTPRQGAETIVSLASEAVPDRGTGKYMYCNSVVEPSALAQDLAVAARLWAESVELLKLGPSIGSTWKWLTPG